MVSLILATMGKLWLLLARSLSPVAVPGSGSHPCEANRDRGGVNDKWDEDCWERKRRDGEEER